jgi:hypothetical protein
MLFEESPENERLRRQRKILIARAVADGRRARYVIPARGKEMRQPEDRRARRERAWLEHKRLEDERRRVAEWIQRENAADESVAAAGTPELGEPFDWRWVDRRIEARLIEERAEMDATLRTVNKAMDAIVRALDNVARAATNDDCLAKPLAEITASMRGITEEARRNQIALLRAIRRKHGKSEPASQANDRASEPSRENARVH